MATPDRIEFEHSFFAAVDNPYFAMETDTAVLVVNIDVGTATLPLKGIKRELKLKEDDADFQMLDTVSEGLKFVNTLKIGDPVPSELTSGRASWEITEADLKLGRGRVTLQLISWLSGDETVLHEGEQILQVLDDPATKSKIQDAFRKASQSLGLGDDGIEEVISLVDNLGHELAYIEALRRQFMSVERIGLMLVKFADIYKWQRAELDKISSIRKLYRIAHTQFTDKFEEVDAQTGEIIGVLKNIASQTNYIRSVRDDLRRRLWAWNEQIAIWQEMRPKQSRECERHLDNIYMFLAQRYLPMDQWVLYSQAQDNAKSKDGEVVW